MSTLHMGVDLQIVKVVPPAVIHNWMKKAWKNEKKCVYPTPLANTSQQSRCYQGQRLSGNLTFSKAWTCMKWRPSFSLPRQAKGNQSVSWITELGFLVQKWMDAGLEPSRLRYIEYDAWAEESHFPSPVMFWRVVMPKFYCIQPFNGSVCMTAWIWNDATFSR